MNKRKLIGLNLLLFLGISSSLGFAFSDQKKQVSASAGSVINSNDSQNLSADTSSDQLNNHNINSKDNCTINASGACAACGVCNGQCFPK